MPEIVGRAGEEGEEEEVEEVGGVEVGADGGGKGCEACGVAREGLDVRLYKSAELVLTDVRTWVDIR